MEKHGKGKTRDEESGRKVGGDAGGAWGRIAKEKEAGKEQGKKGRGLGGKAQGKGRGCGAWRIWNGHEARKGNER